MKSSSSKMLLGLLEVNGSSRGMAGGGSRSWTWDGWNGCGAHAGSERRRLPAMESGVLAALEEVEPSVTQERGWSWSSMLTGGGGENMMEKVSVLAARPRT